jgi:hypothetical protein
MHVRAAQHEHTRNFLKHARHRLPAQCFDLVDGVGRLLGFHSAGTSPSLSKTKARGIMRYRNRRFDLVCVDSSDKRVWRKLLLARLSRHPLIRQEMSSL